MLSNIFDEYVANKEFSFDNLKNYKLFLSKISIIRSQLKCTSKIFEKDC